MSTPGSPSTPAPEPRQARPPAVAGSFYPANTGQLGELVDELLAESTRRHPAPARLAASSVAGVLVPHAGLVYSGIVAAAGWRALLPSPGSLPSTARSPAPAGGSAPVPGAAPAFGSAPALTPSPAFASSGTPPTIILLGTNHGAAWLDGVGAWDGSPWWTPLGEVATDPELTRAIVDLGAPFSGDARCHLGEHSIEVQLPFIARLAPEARIVALSVGTGPGRRGVEAGARLGAMLGARRAAGEPILLAISTDMAHYPAAGIAERVTAMLLPHILALDPESLADAEAALTRAEPRVSCGMCGIAPAVLGLAALRAMGARPGIAIAAATSADAGGDPRRTVGYLSAAFAAG